MTDRQRIAVFFGGRSPEHDISIVTGLQALHAIDSSRYDAFPVYITPQGEWLVGEPLAERANYLPSAPLREQLTRVMPDVTVSGRGVLLSREKRFLRQPPPTLFDIALLAFHGTVGEDGQVQGLFETANIPYTGMRTLASAVLMDKAATKRMLRGLDIPMLPQALISKPASGLMVERKVLDEAVQQITFPAVVKPNHLGSSIGVSKVENINELATVLPQIFRLDPIAILEPYVPNLVEFNVSICRFGTIRTSAIEKPKRTEDLLDFKQKYMPAGLSGAKQGVKSAGQESQGMLSLTRELNPPLPIHMEDNIRRWAEQAFLSVVGTGAPRIDFLCNAATNELWLNEINPCPGSFGYFLWEAAAPPVSFTKLISHLLEEAVEQHRLTQLPSDPTPEQARLFSRR
jgi:D-alanine-D-alanine ligase